MFVPCILNLATTAEALKYFSNFQFDQRTIYGDEHLIKDYVTLANDPKANLPDSFSICSSIFIKFRPGLKDVGIFEMFKEDGSHWFLLNYYVKTLEFFYENPATGKSDMEKFSGTIIPIVPHSWYHACMGLDTVSGLLRIVVNGIEVVNEEKDYFRNTKSWKPRSIENKILLFKAHKNGFWSQQKSAFSNLNIFGSMMTVEDMEKRTSGGDTCAFPGDYLRYKQPCNTAMICTYLF